jgi:hypothetical protein
LHNPFAVIGELVVLARADAVIVESVLDVSLGSPKSHSIYANVAYANAWTGYAADAEFPRLPGAVNVRSADNAIDGDIHFDVTLKSHPMEDVLAWSPTSNVGVIFRRSLDATHLSPLLTARATAHKMSHDGGVWTPRATLMSKLRTIENTQLAENTASMEAVLAFLPEAGIPLIDLDTIFAKCIRKLASELEPTASFVDLHRHAEARFSVAECGRVWLLTAHASKGQTFSRTYIGQPQFFPLEVAVNEGGISLSQEPRVEFVSITRSNRSMCFLCPVDLSDESMSMEVIYFEL